MEPYPRQRWPGTAHNNADLEIDETRRPNEPSGTCRTQGPKQLPKGVQQRPSTR